MINARPGGRANGYIGKLSSGCTRRNRSSAISLATSMDPYLPRDDDGGASRRSSRRPDILISIFIDEQ